MTELSTERAGRITASRLPALLGLSPYQTRDDLMREMVREYFGAEREWLGNVATVYGNEHEADAIAEYERYRGELVVGEQEWFASREYPIGATVDGLVGHDRVAEMKCPYRGFYSHVSERPDYEAQIRLQLEVTRRRFGDLVVWRPSGISVSTVEYETYWFPTVLPLIEEFLAHYKAILEDPDLAEPYLTPLVDERTDEEWSLAALEWHEAKAAVDRAKEHLDAASEVLRKLSDGKKSKGAGVQVIPSQRAGSIDYNAAQKALAIDLEPYRKSASTVLTVRRAAQ